MATTVDSTSDSSLQNQRKRHRSGSQSPTRKSFKIGTPANEDHSALEKAELIKKDQGFHECEVSISTDLAEAEADLHKHLQGCEKNPGHTDFIPVKKFKMKHLAKNYRNNDILNLIRVVISLTVRVCVQYTSFDRPETYPGTIEPYPFYNNRGLSWLRMASGRVCYVTNYTTEEKRKRGKEGETCPCQQCKHSPTPKTEWCEVEVLTAQHVVFDSAEAKHTTCQLFYDSDQEKNKIEELLGETMRSEGNISYDGSWVYCYTHDLQLGKRLEQMRQLFSTLCIKVKKNSLKPGTADLLTAIVAHPHGCSKQVTVGELTHRKKVTENGLTRYTYTAQTCPGSSGAPVFVLGKYRLGYLHAHSARCEKDGFNMSIVWYD